MLKGLPRRTHFVSASRNDKKENDNGLHSESLEMKLFLIYKYYNYGL